MVDTQHITVRPIPFWLLVLAGLGAGGLAAGLLASLPMPFAAAGIVALVLALVVLVYPQLALYAGVGAMIVFWPGVLTKSLDVALGATALLWVLAHRRRIVPRDPVLLILGLLVVLIWFSALRVGGQDAFKRALGYTSYLALYWTVSTVAHSGLVFRRLIGAMLLSGVVIAIIGLVQLKYPFIGIVSFVDRFADYSESGNLVDAQLYEGAFRIESLTGGPNLLGLSMQILLPFAFYWTLHQPNRWRMAAGALGIVFMVAAMVFSLTRGAMLTLALIIAPILMLRIGLRRTLPYAFLALLVLAIGAIAWEPLRERIISNITEFSGGDTTLSGTWRLEAFPIGIKMLQDHFWTGAGIEQQVTLWQAYAPADLIVLREMVLHNDYLLIGIELGVLGLGLMLWLFVAIWRNLRITQQHLRATDQHQLLDYTYAAEAVWLALVVDLMLYPLMHNFRYFWVLVALTGALRAVGRNERQERLPDGAHA